VGYAKNQPAAAESNIAKIVAERIDHPWPPGLSSGTVRIPTVMAPKPANKITPKLVIPVKPVCKFKEKAKIENTQRRTIILVIWIYWV
jgi:hypothetical protein